MDRKRKRTLLRIGLLLFLLMLVNLCLTHNQTSFLFISHIS